MSSADGVSVTTLVAVDPATAFEVFTEEVDLWWKRGPQYRFGRGRREGTMRFEPGPGGRLLEVYDTASGDVYEVGRILVWTPAERLVFEWRGTNFEPGQKTEVDVRFEKANQGTRVTLEHRGWGGLPPTHPARHGLEGPAFTSMIGLWWADLLVALRMHSKDPR